MKYIIFELNTDGYSYIELPYTSENLEYVKSLGVDYEIIENEPSVVEKIEAQATYTAMMTDTLFEE